MVEHNDIVGDKQVVAIIGNGKSALALVSAETPSGVISGFVSRAGRFVPPLYMQREDFFSDEEVAALEKAHREANQNLP